MVERPRIAFVGAGRLAGALAPELARLGYSVAAVASRSRASAERVAASCGSRAAELQEAVDAAQLVFVTTPDDAIGDVAAQVRWRAGQWAAHCSGALTLSPLAPVVEAGGEAGSLHPFQTFGGAASLEGATFGVEAEGALLAALERLALEFGGYPLRVGAESRALYHAASVMSCGYLTTLLNEARTLWLRAGLPPEGALRAIVRLARTTLSNVEGGGLAGALTGPTSRGDAGTVRLHLEAVQEAAPDLLPLYREISLRSVELAREAGRPGGSADWSGVFGAHVGGADRTERTERTERTGGGS